MTTSIAIIKDRRTPRSSLSGFLDAAGEFRVSAEYHGLDHARAQLPGCPVDIAIIDLCVEESSGVEFIAGMSKLMQKIKWLVYTVFDDEDTIFAALRAGAHGYILKDSEPRRLERALHELSGGGVPFSPRVGAKLLNYFRHSPAKEIGNYFLSPREKETLRLVSLGLLTKEIAQQLGIQRETVKKHLSNIYSKLDVQNKIEALNKFYGLKSTNAIARNYPA